MNGTTFTASTAFSFQPSALSGGRVSSLHSTMKTLFALIVAAICYLPSPISFAESPYKQGEVTADVFGTYAQSKAKLNDAFDRQFKNGTFGAGIGLNYFFHRNVAIGADAVIPSASQASHSFFDQVNLNLTARLPIGDSGLAPYLVGSLGRNMETGEYTSGAAVGAEYRLTKAVGVFAEGRYTWGNRDNTDFAQARVGVRFNF